jgi:hypothetical protein
VQENVMGPSLTCQLSSVPMIWVVPSAYSTTVQQHFV